jgi:hypothetical protein
MKKQYYDPDNPHLLRKAVARAERKLEELHIRENIVAIKAKLNALDEIKRLYPPHNKLEDNNAE